MKKPQPLKRTESNIISISIAFSAMKYNLMSIEDCWTNNTNVKVIPVMAYFNYLCLYALCIELGLKDIIISQRDTEKTHQIKDLYYETHDIFQKKVKLLYESSFKSDFVFDDFLSDISNMFEDLRYLNFNGNVNYGKFFEKEGKEIDIKELWEKNTYLQFLILFCNEIEKLLLFLESETSKKTKLNYPGINDIEKKIMWKKKILDECLTLEENII